MRRPLLLPTSLVVTACTFSACASNPAPDAGPDVVTDRGASDVAPADLPADQPMAELFGYDAGVDCVVPFLADVPGLACRPRRDAAAGTVCPERVCAAEDCPAGTCESCRLTIQCIPDPAADVAVVCEGVTCDPQGCPRGCLFA